MAGEIHKAGEKCNCPTSYSRCLRWVQADAARGDLSRGHGGWGWPDGTGREPMTHTLHRIATMEIP